MADEQNPMHGVTAHLTIREGKGSAAVDFYKAAFDAEELGRHLAEDGTRILHSHLRINQGSVMLNDDFPEYTGGVAVPAGVTLHIQTEDADQWWERALAAGATVRMPLDNQFWGDRYGQLDDPFGHHWSIGGPLKA
jgi:PhnB protein